MECVCVCVYASVELKLPELQVLCLHVVFGGDQALDPNPTWTHRVILIAFAVPFSHHEQDRNFDPWKNKKTNSEFVVV